MVQTRDCLVAIFETVSQDKHVDYMKIWFDRIYMTLQVCMGGMLVESCVILFSCSTKQIRFVEDTSLDGEQKALYIQSISNGRRRLYVNVQLRTKVAALLSRQCSHYDWPKPSRELSAKTFIKARLLHCYFSDPVLFSVIVISLCAHNGLPAARVQFQPSSAKSCRPQINSAQT